MCTGPHTFQHLYGLDSGDRRMLERSSCSASFRNVKISDLDFADDAVIRYPFRVLEVLNEESETLGL